MLHGVHRSARRQVVCLLFVAMLALAACGEEETFNAPAGSSTEVQSIPTPRITPTPTELPDPSTRPDAVMYAEQVGVSFEEALDRLERQGDFGPLNGALEANERETFAGAYLQHEPEFKFVVLFTRNGEETIRKYVAEGSELDEFVEVREVRFSLDELTEIRKEADKVIGQLDNFSPSSWISVQANEVHYDVQNAEQAVQFLVDAGLALPEGAAFVGDGQPVEFAVPEPVEGIYIAIHKPEFGGMDRDDVEFSGTLLLIDGCLVIESEWYDGLVLPIWNSDHRLQVLGDDIAVVNGNGEVVAKVDQPIWSGGSVSMFRREISEDLYYPVPDTCRMTHTWRAIGVQPLDQQPVIPTPVPEGAPLGLHTADWPGDFAAVDAILANLPDQIGEGLERWEDTSDDGRLIVGYGPPNEPGLPRLIITDLTTGDHFPDFWTTSDLIASQFMGVGGRAVGWYENLSWASEDTNRTGRDSRYDQAPVHALNWGTSAGKVLFTASAAEYDLLELLVAAVIEAQQ